MGAGLRSNEAKLKPGQDGGEKEKKSKKRKAPACESVVLTSSSFLSSSGTLQSSRHFFLAYLEIASQTWRLAKLSLKNSKVGSTLSVMHSRSSQRWQAS